MNIIFLDVDGVLNSHRYLRIIYEKESRPHSDIDYPFDPLCMEQLKRIINETNAKIVITSTWRRDNFKIKKLLGEFKKYNLLNNIFGNTAILKNRSLEIKDYLKDYPDINYIIIDDGLVDEDLMPNLIKTDVEDGLTIDLATQAIEKLNGLKRAR